MENENAVICPPCGEQSLAPEGFNPGVAVATKEGQNKKNALWPLLPRLTAVLPPQGREKTKGFTLIELLVVVLIIGILAVVALPQYQRAVYKSRLATLKHLAHALAQAQEVYYLANGEYSTKIEELDVEMPSGKDTTKSRDDTYFYDWGHCGITAHTAQCRNSQTNMQYQIWLSHSSENPTQNKVACIVFSPAEDLNDTASQVCKAETNDISEKTFNSRYVWWFYQ